MEVVYYTNHSLSIVKYRLPSSSTCQPSFKRFDPWKLPEMNKGEDEKDNTGLIIAIVVVFIIFGVIGILLAICCLKKYRKGKLEKLELAIGTIEMNNSGQMLPVQNKGSPITNRKWGQGDNIL